MLPLPLLLLLGAPLATAFTTPVSGCEQARIRGIDQEKIIARSTGSDLEMSFTCAAPDNTLMEIQIYGQSATPIATSTTSIECDPQFGWNYVVRDEGNETFARELGQQENVYVSQGIEYCTATGPGLRFSKDLVDYSTYLHDKAGSVAKTRQNAVIDVDCGKAEDGLYFGWHRLPNASCSIVDGWKAAGFRLTDDVYDPAGFVCSGTPVSCSVQEVHYEGKALNETQFTAIFDAALMKRTLLCRNPLLVIHARSRADIDYGYHNTLDCIEGQGWYGGDYSKKYKMAEDTELPTLSCRPPRS